MNDTIKCPHCKKDFKPSEAYAHQIEEQLKRAKEEGIVETREKAKKWQEEQTRKFNEEKKAIEETAKKKAQEELELKLKNSKNEVEELSDKNRKLQADLLDNAKRIRAMKERQEEMELENQKKLAAAEDAIKEEARKKAEEQAHFKILEFEKKLNDAAKANEDLRRKLEQGSQQMQGEVLELELEKLLMQEFPFDEVKPVPKGIRGADILHIVRNNTGLTCGVILWELKRTKSWSNDWVVKLKDDQRTVKADCAVLISQVVPDTIKFLGEIQGVIVGEYTVLLGIARLVRTKLIETSVYRSASQNSDEKKDILYNYVTSREFKHRMDAIAESFKMQQDTLETEKRWFAKKWSNQEKALRKMVDNTYGMLGELEGIMGRELESAMDADILPDKIEVDVEVTVEEQLF